MNPLVPGRMLTWQDQVLKRFTLTEGQVFSERLTGQGLISDIYVRLDTTFVNGASTVATLDGVLRMLGRISIEIDSEQLLNVTPSEQFNLMNWLDKTQMSFTQLATSGAGLTPFFVVHIPLSLHQSYGYPARHATALPAGLCNNFVVRIEPAAAYTTATLSTVGTGTFGTPGVATVSIHARTALMSRQELKDHINRSGGVAFFQDSVDNNAVGTATEIETRAKTGRGALIGYYTRTATNGALTSTAADNAVTTTRLVAGASDFIVDSRHLELQSEAKARYNVETPPVGSYYHTFSPNGDITEGIPLVGVNDLRLLQTFGGSPSSGFTRNIFHLLLPGFYTRLLAN